MKFALIGASRTGITIAYHLWKKGHIPVSLWNRSESKFTKIAEFVPFETVTSDIRQIDNTCDFIIFSVSDDVLEIVVADFFKHHKIYEQLIFHTSGSMDSSVFGDYKKSGSLHPVISIASIEKGIEVLPLTTFTCEGEIAKELQKIALEIGKNGVILSSQQKKAIHLSAVFMNNYLNGLMEEVKRFNQKYGIENAGEILQEITLQTVNQGWLSPIEKSLTGPVKRGDEKTIRQHLEMLENDKLLQQLYKNFGNILLKFVNSDNEKYIKLENLFKTCEK